MPAERARPPKTKQAALVLIDQPPALDTDVPLLAGAMKRRTLASRDLLDLGQRVGLLMRANHGNAALDDPRFFGRDRSQRGAEEFDVIDAYRGNHARHRLLDHVGGV